MSKNRPARVADEVRRLLADLIRNEVKDPRVPLMTSVTEVEMSGDLSHAVVYVSVMGTQDEQKACIEGLSKASGFMRRELGRRMHIRTSPELHFRLDNSITQGLEMDRLIDEVLGKNNLAEDESVD